MASQAAASIAVAGKGSIKIDMAMLVSPSDDTLRVVPKSIKCPTVEQFAAGVVQKATRDNISGLARDR